MPNCCPQVYSVPTVAGEDGFPPFYTSVVIDGVTVAGSGNTTFVTTFLEPQPYSLCVEPNFDFTYPGTQVILMGGFSQSGLPVIFQHDLYFSSYITEITIYVAWQFVPGSQPNWFTNMDFISNTGPVTVSLCDNCCGILNGNTFVMSPNLSNVDPICDATPIAVASYVTISSNIPFNSLSIQTGPNLEENCNAIAIAICSFGESEAVNPPPYELCVPDCSGNTVTLQVPYPVYTNEYGTAVTQLNAVALGGPNGLNN